MQSLIYFYYTLDYIQFKKFQPFNFSLTMMRVLASLTLHSQMHTKFIYSVKILKYLKCMRPKKSQINIRNICILLVSMQICLPFFAMFLMIIASAQDSSMSSMVKTYYYIAFVAHVDEIFMTMV